MKISKLFHWCYAFLMLLPIGAIGVKCGYVMLNKNANQSYQGSYNYESTTLFGNIYQNLQFTTIDSSNAYIEDSNTIQTYYASNLSSSVIYGRTISVFEVISSNLNYSGSYNILILGRENDSKSVQVRLYDIPNIDLKNDTITYNYAYGNISISSVNSLSYPSLFYKNLDSTTEILRFTTNNNVVRFNVNNQTLSNSYNTLTKLFINIFYTDISLSSVFYSSLQELDKVEFFSWAKNSFLAQPFMYIGNLFGIPNVHPIFTFLSYWCAISIIWLVFDLFMYMPLLVHKWIDKAKVE